MPNLKYESKVDEMLRVTASLLLDGSAGESAGTTSVQRKEVAKCLAYLRDRVGVPRDTSYPRHAAPARAPEYAAGRARNTQIRGTTGIHLSFHSRRFLCRLTRTSPLTPRVVSRVLSTSGANFMRMLVFASAARLHSPL